MPLLAAFYRDLLSLALCSTMKCCGFSVRSSTEAAVQLRRACPVQLHYSDL